MRRYDDHGFWNLKNCACVSWPNWAAGLSQHSYLSAPRCERKKSAMTFEVACNNLYQRNHHHRRHQQHHDHHHHLNHHHHHHLHHHHLDHDYDNVGKPRNIKPTTMPIYNLDSIAFGRITKMKHWFKKTYKNHEWIIIGEKKRYANHLLSPLLITGNQSPKPSPFLAPFLDPWLPLVPFAWTGAESWGLTWIYLDMLWGGLIISRGLRRLNQSFEPCIFSRFFKINTFFLLLEPRFFFQPSTGTTEFFGGCCRG